MKYLRFSLAIIVAAGLSANAQTTATTSPVGFATISPAAGTVSICPGFVEAAVFQGNSTASTSANTFSGSFTPGSYAPTSQGYPTTYVQVISSNSTYAGYIFDVASVNGQGAIVSSDPIPSGLNGQTVQIVVRPHLTLNKLIQGATGLADYSDAATFINANGSLTTCIYADGSWLADDYSTPIGDLPIYPGTGFTLTSSGAAKLTTVGSVQTAPVAVPLYAGTPNLVNQMNPGAAVKVQSLNIASVMAPYSDVFNSFSGTGNMAISGTYYSDGTDLLDSDYNPLPPNSSASVDANGAIAVTASSDTVWKAPAPTIAQ